MTIEKFNKKFSNFVKARTRYKMLALVHKIDLKTQLLQVETGTFYQIAAKNDQNFKFKFNNLYFILY